MLKERLAVCKFDAFKYEVRIILSGDVVESRERRDRLLGEYDGVPAMAIHNASRDDPASYVFLPFWAEAGLVAHESWHAVRAMLNYCGAELENEVVAYSLGYLVDAIHKALRRRK